MLNNRMVRWFTLSLLSLSVFTTVSAQYQLDEQVSFVYLNGTSTLHDWQVSVGQMKGFLKATVVNTHITKIDSAYISIPVSSIKSDKKLMSENIYKALKAAQYPQITYRLKNHIIHDGTITVTGELTIAGVTRDVQTKVKQEGIGKHIKISGDVKLRMTDFEVTPPEFLLGAFKTGDEIAITFYFMFYENGN